MRYVCLTQGIYFMLAGVWPLVNIHSFEVITGPKVDVWLVKTVGLLVAVIGAVLLLSGARGHVSVEVFALATATAMGLAWIDTWYVVRNVIPPIYMLDAILELGLVLAWELSWLMEP